MGVRTSAQYVLIMQKMLPKGRAWARSSTSCIFKILFGFSEELARADAMIDQIHNEVDPSTATDFITDWEKTVGLPDATQAISPYIDERRADVVRKFTDPGGQSDSYFEFIAGSFGYDVTISLFKPFRMGSRCHDKLYNYAWRDYFQVNSPSIVVRRFRCTDPCNSKLATWRNNVLEAVINNATQSHAQAIFTYGDPL